MLQLAALGAFATTTEIRCTYNLQIEMHKQASGNRASFKYGICDTKEGETYYLPEETGTARSAPYKAGEMLTLRVEEEPAGMAAARAARSRHSELFEASALSNASTYRVLETLERQGGLTSDASARVTVEARTLFVMRLVYDDHEPDYCNEKCARNGIWGEMKIDGGDVKGSVDGVFRESSFGKSSFDESNSVVFSVSMGKKAPKPGAGCPTSEEMRKADKKARKQSGRNPKSFTHREYIVPTSFGSCGWGGLANVGCAPDGAGPQPGGCYSFIREYYPTTRAHEFGHNIGLDHGGRYGDEYGDDSSIMGATIPWKGFTAPHRYHSGWLPGSSKKAYSSAGLTSLRSLHLPPSDTSGDYSALAFQCTRCDSPSYNSGRSSGEVLISFRAPKGYDKDLPRDMQNKVFVHLQPESSWGWPYQSITELYAVLGEGESYTVSRSGHHIIVCSINGLSASVYVKTGSSSGLSSGCSGGAGGEPPSASPSPSPPSSGEPPCACNGDGVSGGVSTGVIGCGDHLFDGEPYCYVVSPGSCGTDTPSEAYPGAGWRDCVLASPPPSEPSPPPSPSPSPSPPAPPTPSPSPLTCTWAKASKGDRWCGQTHNANDWGDADKDTIKDAKLGRMEWDKRGSGGWRICDTNLDKCKRGCTLLGGCAEISLTKQKKCCYISKSTCNGSKRKKDTKYVSTCDGGGGGGSAAPPAPPPSDIVKRCVDPSAAAPEADEVRIVGGEPIDYPRQLSFLVSLFHWGGPNCGGTIIADKWVLTAAHCMVNGMSSGRNEVKIGMHSAKGENKDDCVQSRTAKRVINHPKYNSGTMKNDISLIELDEAVDYPPVLLGSTDLEAKDTPLTVAGWGTTSSGGSSPDKPRRVTVPAWSDSGCKSAYPGQIKSGMICAGMTGGGKDSCQGDSGGPLYSEADGNRVVGVVSWGYGCAVAGRPGVYTSVAAYADWICSTTGSEDLCRQASQVATESAAPAEEEDDSAPLDGSSKAEAARGSVGVESSEDGSYTYEREPGSGREGGDDEEDDDGEEDDEEEEDGSDANAGEAGGKAGGVKYSPGSEAANQTAAVPVFVMGIAVVACGLVVLGGAAAFAFWWMRRGAGEKGAKQSRLRLPSLRRTTVRSGVTTDSSRSSTSSGAPTPTSAARPTAREDSISSNGSLFSARV